MVVAGAAGFEPTHNGVKVRCLTAWLYPINEEINFSSIILYTITYKSVNEFSSSRDILYSISAPQFVQ